MGYGGCSVHLSGVSEKSMQRAYLKPPGTLFQSEPTGTAAAAVHSPSLKPGLRQNEGGTHGHGTFKEGGTKGGRGSREGGVGWGWRGLSGWVVGCKPRSTHLVCVEEERFGENSSLKDLSPISVETADKGHDTYIAVADNKQTAVNKQGM